MRLQRLRRQIQAIGDHRSKIMMIMITLTIIMTVMTILIIPLVVMTLVMIPLISGLADTTSFSWRLALAMTMTRPQLQSEEQ